jgi:hypothetical protein
MGKASESIFTGSVVVPMADVQHMEMHPKNCIPGMHIITKHTKWNHERDIWENSIWLNEPEAGQFRRAWCAYRSEIESETLADLAPA